MNAFDHQSIIDSAVSHWHCIYVIASLYAEHTLAYILICKQTVIQTYNSVK